MVFATNTLHWCDVAFTAQCFVIFLFLFLFFFAFCFSFFALVLRSCHFNFDSIWFATSSFNRNSWIWLLKIAQRCPLMLVNQIWSERKKKLCHIHCSLSSFHSGDKCAKMNERMNNNSNIVSLISNLISISIFRKKKKWKMNRPIWLFLWAMAINQSVTAQIVFFFSRNAFEFVLFPFKLSYHHEDNNWLFYSLLLS